MISVNGQVKQPDEYGNYWLIARSSGVFKITNDKSADRGKYMVCPSAAEVPFKDGRIQAFDTPQEAWERLLQIEKRRR